MFRHGMARSKIYKSYINMKQRCSPQNNRYHKYYSDRGICVCDEWLGEKGFEHFYLWAIEHGYSESLTLDRIDNSKGYSPNNCRWVSMSVQNANRRNRGKTEYIGVSKNRNVFEASIRQNGQVVFYACSKSKNECAQKRNEFIIANNLMCPLNDIKDEFEEHFPSRNKSAYVVIDKRTGEIRWFEKLSKLSDAVNLSSRHIRDCINEKYNCKKYRFYRVKADDNNY